MRNLSLINVCKVKMNLRNFIIDFYCLVEFCEYGFLKEEMICDWLVVGIRNEKFSEKL